MEELRDFLPDLPNDKQSRSSPDEEILSEKPRSILLSLLKQLTTGADLHRITLPVFILERQSLLEKVTDFMSYPDLLLHLPQESSGMKRMLGVVKYYMSTWHLRPSNEGVKKPYNPVLGEYFRCAWEVNCSGAKNEPKEEEHLLSLKKCCCGRTSHSYYFSEQLSHHPPISGYFYCNPQHGVIIEGNFRPRSKFLGNSAVSLMEGESRLRFFRVVPNDSIRSYCSAPVNKATDSEGSENSPSATTDSEENRSPYSFPRANSAIVVTSQSSSSQSPVTNESVYGDASCIEEYIMTNPNVYVRGIVIGRTLTELGDSVEIQCPSTGYIAKIEFKTKGYFSGAYNEIGGVISHRTKKGVLDLFRLSGKWSDKMFLTPILPLVKEVDYMAGLDLESSRFMNIPFIDVEKLTRTYKLTSRKMTGFESRRLWMAVSKSLEDGNEDEASKVKASIEEDQRMRGKLLVEKFWRESSTESRSVGEAGDGERNDASRSEISLTPMSAGGLAVTDLVLQYNLSPNFMNGKGVSHTYTPTTTQLIPYTTRYFATEDGVHWSFRFDQGNLEDLCLQLLLKDCDEMEQLYTL